MTPTAADLEKARACMSLDAGPDWVANVAAALAEEREACAAALRKYAERHYGVQTVNELVAAIYARGK